MSTRRFFKHDVAEASIARGPASEMTPVLANRIARIARPPSEPATPLRSERTPSFKTARLRLLHGEEMDVVIKNISEGGACIAFVQDIALTDRVYLSEATMRLRVWAYVVWQERHAAGLAFAPA